MADDNFYAPENDNANPYAAPTTQDNVSSESGPALAPLGSRFSGAFIDGFLTLPAAAGAYFVAFELGKSGALGQNFFVLQLVGGLIGLCIGLLWYLILNGYLLAKRGQTIGKLVAKTRIVDAETNQLIPLGPLVLKRFVSFQFIALIPVVGMIIGLINILMIFRENRKCLHDDLAGSKVIVAS